jgi:hypothetical protein
MAFSYKLIPREMKGSAGNFAEAAGTGGMTSLPAIPQRDCPMAAARFRSRVDARVFCNICGISVSRSFQVSSNCNR